jgi:hypothetical protein
MRATMVNSAAQLSEDLYSKPLQWLMEAIQNADDNIYPPGSTPVLHLDVLPDGLAIFNNEVGFSTRNVRAICAINSSKTEQGCIGEKGALLACAAPALLCRCYAAAVLWPSPPRCMAGCGSECG